MKNILFYLLQMIIASGMLYGYYHFFLRNKKFHRYNRFFLLAAVIISIAIPFLNIPVYFSKENTDSSVLLQTLSVISFSGGEETTAVVLSESSNQIASWFSWQNIIYALYILIALIFILRIYLSVRKIQIISSNYPQEKIGDIHFVNTSEPGTPFSFFRWLFWNKDIELNSDKGQQIFRHELFHINQRHTMDTVFMEFITAFAWFNPVFHLIKKEIKTIHEFLADEYAMSKSGDWQYAELLLMQALNTKLSLVNPFFHTQIKRRIAMITTSPKPGHQYLRKLLVLPVAAVIAVLFAFSYKNKKTGNEPSIKSSEPITIVVDPGHGGDDKGAKSIDGLTSEAALTLEISKIIQRLAPEYNINVVMTRENDKFPGNVANKKDGLRKRVEISNSVKPSAFISIHINSAGRPGIGSPLTGFDAYISSKSGKLNDKILASAIIKEISNLYAVSSHVKARNNAGLFVLDSNIAPSVILECGYITNPKDLIYISEKFNQEKVARAILSGVSQFVNNKTTSIQEKNISDTPKIKRPDTLAKVKGNVEVQWKNSSAVNDSTGPLIVLDGKILDNITVNQLDQYLKPESIESINVLKDGSAISKYGTKAKNGVIEIITKKQIKVKEVTLTDNSKQPIKTTEVALWDRGTTFDNKIFEKVEVEPTFPGGAEGWKAFLRDNLHPEVPVDSGAKAGIYKTKVRFIVDKDGNIGSFDKVTKNGFGMEEEVIRVITTGPKWIPAMQKGKAVNAYKVETVTFEFTEDVMPDVNPSRVSITTDRSSNVLFLGIVNPLTISMSDTKSEDLNVNISQGSIIKRPDGKYNATVNFAGEAIITVSSKTSTLPAQKIRFKSMPLPKSSNNEAKISTVISKNIPIEKVREIELNKTSLSKIQSLFGEPISKSIENNSIFWIYEANNSRLDIQFNRQAETITNFRFTGMVNLKRGNIDYNQAKSIKENSTTFSELEKKFGLPYQVEINNNDEIWTYEGLNSRLAVVSKERQSRVINSFRYNN